jgi:uncharacterized cofD-like protein
MGVKRWAFIIGLFALILILGLMGLIGRENLREIFIIFTNSPIPVWSLVGGLIAIGTIGVFIGINGLVRSIIREISPEAEGRASELIYSKRVLSRGPRVVALGGGTGLSTLLRGLKYWTSNITAVVTVMDDGGSSGRLRRERQMLPPGDIRNCLIALAEDESKIAELFAHRFEKSGSDIDGHSLGNLVLTGLQEMTGSFDRSIEEFSRLVKIRGQVLPSTLQDVELVAEMADGTVITGECKIAETSNRITKMSLSESTVQPYPKVLSAIEKADIIVLGPGSLYTSIIPNLLVDEIAQSIERSKAAKFYISNLMTQPGETDEFTLKDHLDELGQYLNLNEIDFILMNGQDFPEELLSRYESENSVPVMSDFGSENGYFEKIVDANLLDIIELEGKQTIKHHSENLARAIAKYSKHDFADRTGKN